MTGIATVVAQIIARPAPVIILDTCSLLDLFRRDPPRQQPRVPADEIRIAAELIQRALVRPEVVYLVVPELVPGEYGDHANRIERDFDGWFEAHDQNQEWLARSTTWINVPLPIPTPVHPLGLCAGFRQLADDLLAQATALDRDPGSLDRAVARLLAKRRPSHKKEIKDSMNLEQSLELCSRLRNAGFSGPMVFLSSNTNDFAASPTNARLHNDLQADFAAVSLEYFPSLRAAVGSLRARGELP